MIIAIIIHVIIALIHVIYVYKNYSSYCLMGMMPYSPSKVPALRWIAGGLMIWGFRVLGVSEGVVLGRAQSSRRRGACPM